MIFFLGRSSNRDKNLVKSLILCGFTLLASSVLADDDWADQVDGLGGNLSNAYLPGNPYRSAIPITVIDRRMIEASGAQSIDEVLRIVPGLVTGHRFGHQLALGSHGNSEEYMRRTNIIIDGRSLFTPVVGGLISFNMPVTIDDIERIEVYRGPAGSEFGSNSMINTVRIYTASAMEKQGTKVKVVKGTNHQNNSYVRHGFAVGEAFFTTSYSQTEDEGLRNRDDSMKRKQLFLRGDYQVDDENELTVTLGASNQDIDVWVTSNPTSNDHDADDESAFINATWVKAIDEGDIVSNFSHTYLDRSSYYLAAAPHPSIGRLRYETGYYFHSTAVDSKITKYLTDTTEVSLGGKISSDRVVSDSLFKDNEYRLNSGAVYGKYIWQILDGTSLHFGSMYEDLDSMSHSAFAYNFAIIQSINANNKIRFGYNKGTRLPWIYEENAARKFYLHDKGDIPYYDVYSVGDLEPEEVVQHDITWMYNNNSNSLNAEIRLFQDEYKTLIANNTAPNPGINSATGKTVISFASFDNPSTVKGVEASVNWQPNGDWLLVMSGSYTDIDSHLEKGSFTGNAGEAGPSSTFSMLGERKLGQYWKVGGMFTFVSGFNWSNGWHIESQEAMDLYAQRCFGDFGAAGFCAKVAGTDLFGGKSDFRPEAYRERAYRVEASIEF